MTMTYSRFGAVSAGETPVFTNAAVKMDLDKIELAIREASASLQIPPAVAEIELNPVITVPNISIDLSPIVDSIREIPVPVINQGAVNVQAPTVNVGGPNIVVVMPRWPKIGRAHV